MIIGLTGTRSGMNEQQKAAVYEFLKSQEVGTLHHGDCVGVDVEVAELAKSLGWKVVCHPPIKDELRAFHKSNEFQSPLSYFARNRNIVDECELLMVVPYQDSPQNQGGTWYTHDYAVKKGKPVQIFYPGREN